MNWDKPKFHKDSILISFEAGPQCDPWINMGFATSASLKKRGALYRQHCFKCQSVHWYFNERVHFRYLTIPCRVCGSRLCHERINNTRCTKKRASWGGISSME